MFSCICLRISHLILLLIFYISFIALPFCLFLSPAFLLILVGYYLHPTTSAWPHLLTRSGFFLSLFLLYTSFGLRLIVFKFLGMSSRAEVDLLMWLHFLPIGPNLSFFLFVSPCDLRHKIDWPKLKLMEYGRSCIGYTWVIGSVQKRSKIGPHRTKPTGSSAFLLENWFLKNTKMHFIQILIIQFIFKRLNDLLLIKYWVIITACL